MTGRAIITVGATAPARVWGQALFLDGEHAAPQTVDFHYDDRHRALIWGNGSVAWPYDDIRVLPDQAGDDLMVLHRASNPVRRLVLTDAEDRRLIRTRARSLTRRAPPRGRGRLLAWAAAAVAAVALIIFVLVPILADQLARYLPPEGEKALGDATFEQIRLALDDTGLGGLQTCDDPEGRAALDRVQARLTGDRTFATPLTVHVLDHPMVNAFALPGGYVVFFRGLIDQAETPEEVAAVFSHEIGHVEARDPTRIALRSAGSIGVLGLLLGDFAGGALVLFLAEQIIRADYTQEAEAAADAYAHAMLLDADLPPSAIGRFFERLAETHPDAGMLQHLKSHPALGDRIAAARNAEPQDATFRPLLDDAEWQALRGICS